MYKALKSSDSGINHVGANWHKCAECGKWFNKKRSRKSKRVFCDKKCNGKFYRKENHYSWRSGERTCLQCRKVFNSVRNGKVRRGKYFCSQSCREKFFWEKDCWVILKNGKRRLYKTRIKKEIKKALNSL